MFPRRDELDVRDSFERATDTYAEYGVDVDMAMKRLADVPLSLHCWQGDDVAGFEVHEGAVDGGGLLATGGYPGRARNGDELRADYDAAIGLIPGRLRVNLHAIYAETGGKAVERNHLTPDHFKGWIDWARERGYGLDFNPTFFAHPNAASGYTLAHADQGIRQFWIEHGIASRHIAAAMGAATVGPAINNVWIPDGAKDHPVDRWGPRQRLRDSLDAIFAESLPDHVVRDSVEGKLFGLGSEDYVVGSHEFYLSYCIRTGKVLCMDMGHYHPTETIEDKVSAVLTFLDEILLHVSRGIRWDSDHVVIVNDDVLALCREIVRGETIGRTYFALDYFDASINRVAAWVIGARSFLRSLLIALLEPTDTLRRLDDAGNGAAKLGLLQELMGLPHGAMWDYYCLQQDVPAGAAWLDEIARYEAEVQSKR